MSQYLIDQIALVPSIRVDTETQVVSAHGTECLRAIDTRKEGEPVTRRAVDALFVMIGADAVTHWLPPELYRENGYVRTGREVSDQPGWAGERAPYLPETSLPGFFCVGDVRYNSITLGTSNQECDMTVRKPVSHYFASRAEVYAESSLQPRTNSWIEI